LKGEGSVEVAGAEVSGFVGGNDGGMKMCALLGGLECGNRIALAAAVDQTATNIRTGMWM